MTSVKGQIINVQLLGALCNTIPAGEWKQPWTTQQHVQVSVLGYGVIGKSGQWAGCEPQAVGVGPLAR